MALQSAHLYLPQFTPSSFKVWTQFDLSNMTKPEMKNLKKLAPATNIPIDQLRPQIANLGRSPLTQIDLGFTILEEVQDLV